jgi:hypothetical protein
MSERSTAEILRAARERIADPARWTKGTFARTEAGREVSAQAEIAVRWCARGSLYRECGSACTNTTRRAEQTLRDVVPDIEIDLPFDVEPIAWINDNGIHAHVLELYDRAISFAEEASS